MGRAVAVIGAVLGLWFAITAVVNTFGDDPLDYADCSGYPFDRMSEKCYDKSTSTASTFAAYSKEHPYHCSSDRLQPHFQCFDSFDFKVRTYAEYLQVHDDYQGEDFCDATGLALYPDGRCYDSEHERLTTRRDWAANVIP